MQVTHKPFLRVMQIVMACFVMAGVAKSQQSTPSLTLGDQVFTMAKTDQGCSYYEINELKSLFAASEGELSSKKWSGACVIGLAEGIGSLELIQVTPSLPARVKVVVA